MMNTWGKRQKEKTRKAMEKSVQFIADNANVYGREENKNKQKQPNGVVIIVG